MTSTMLEPEAIEKIKNELLQELELQEVSKLPVVLTPKDIIKFTGLGHNKVYEKLKAGEIPSKIIGREYKIPRLMFLKWWYSPDKPQLQKGVNV